MIKVYYLRLLNDILKSNLQKHLAYDPIIVCILV